MAGATNSIGSGSIQLVTHYELVCCYGMCIETIDHKEVKLNNKKPDS